MAIIGYLDSFPGPNSLEIIATRPEHEVIRLNLNEGLDACLAHLPQLHAYQCVGARDEVPAELRVGAEFLRRAPNLLVVSASGSGVDVFDLPACTSAGVVAVNQAGANAEAVAEHALAMMISTLKNISVADRALRRGWRESRASLIGRNLYGRTVGVVGLGHIGKRLAQICQQAFQCEVLAYDPFLTDELITARNATPVSFEQLLARSDIVSVHTPLTPETNNMFDAKAFAAMKPGAIFVITARGTIYDEAALASALASGHLHGAGLDVWATEPPLASHVLVQSDRVIASPHVAGVTTDSVTNMGAYAANQLLTIFDGQRPPRAVNPEVFPAFEARYQSIFGTA